MVYIGDDIPEILTPENAGEVVLTDTQGNIVPKKDPDKKFLSPQAREEIMRLSADMTEKAKAMHHSRTALIEFLYTTRQQMGIPTNEIWDITKDACMFVKVGTIPEEVVKQHEAAGRQVIAIPSNSALNGIETQEAKAQEQ